MLAVDDSLILACASGHLACLIHTSRRDTEDSKKEYGQNVEIAESRL